MLRLSDFYTDDILAPLSEEPRDYRIADYTFEVIMDRIKEFEENLDDDHEVAL